MKCSLTVFTPTYNRGYILNSLYESLQRQTCKDFEWIIVDDASTDNTEELVREWENLCDKFPIRYYKMTHGGKHRAINRAVQLSMAPAFFIVDSDDYLTDDAVVKAVKWFEAINKDDSFAGVSGMKGYSVTKTIGGTGGLAIGEYIDATNLEREKLHLHGDKAEIYKTTILKQYPFKEFSGENFITEATIWNKIALNGYKMRWYNEIIYIANYLEDGLTAKGNNLFYKNPRGWLHWLWIKSQYASEEDVRLDYIFWYAFNCNSTIVYEMPEKYKYMAIKVIDNVVLKLNSYIKNNKVYKYAIFGLGKYGEFFLKIKDRISASLLVGIDTNKKLCNEIDIYKPEDIPKLDIDFVLITMKKKDKSIDLMLDKINVKKIWLVDLL